MTGSNITLQALQNVGAIFSYEPPTRFLRVSRVVENPNFMIPLNLDSNEVDIDEVSEQIADFLSGRYIGIDLDFYPLLPHDPVSSVDVVRDFHNMAQVVNFYNQTCATGSPKCQDVCYVAEDMPTHKRQCKYSKYILNKTMLHQKAKHLYKTISLSCVRLFDATQQQIEEAGFMYFPNNMAKGKLNSRFVDAIKAMNPGFVPLPSSLVLFLSVERITDPVELKSVHQIIDNDIVQFPEYSRGLDLGLVFDNILDLDPEDIESAKV